VKTRYLAPLAISVLLFGMLGRSSNSEPGAKYVGAIHMDFGTSFRKAARRVLVVSSLLLSGGKTLTLVLLVLAGIHAHAQSDELNPEFDVYHKLTPDLRFDFQAMQSRQGGTPNSPEIGPSLDFYLMSMQSLMDITKPGKDDSKTHPVVLSIGYRYLPTIGQPPINRIVPVARSTCRCRRPWYCSATGTAETWTGRTVSISGVIVTGHSFNGPFKCAPIIFRRMSARSCSTKASMESGVTPLCMPAACSLLASMQVSIRTTNIRIIPARNRISS